MQRFKCIAYIDGQPNQPMIFKRYGTNVDSVKSELSSFINESYMANFNITDVEIDKTHPAEKEKQNA